MEQISLKKMIKNDYTMTVSLCCILVGVLTFVLFDRLGIIVSKRGIRNEDDPVFGIIMLAIAGFGLLNALRRYLCIRSIFERGVNATATVSGSSFFKDRGRISYRYQYEGREYRRGLAVMKTKATKAFYAGEKIFVLLDERKPKRSLILSLYSNNEEQPPQYFYSDEQAEQIMAELKRQTAVPAIRIQAHKAEASLPLSASKFGGLPYWNPAEPYPTGTEGKKLVLLAQLNMAEVPPLEDFPSTGILQFFIGTEELYGLNFDDQCEQKDWRVIYHESIDKSITEESLKSIGIASVEALSETEQANFPFTCEFALSFERTEQCISPASDERFVAAVRRAAEALGLPFPEDSTSSYDLFSEDKYNDFSEQSLGHHLGGQPSFTQYDPRDLSDRHDRLLFQMDSEWDASKGSEGIMWGDMGVANFFIAQESLRRRDFSDILYNWDCG